MKKNNKKGFTLVELVIVVAVMAILVAVAIPTVSSITTKATNATNDSNARTIESMIKLYEAEQKNTNNTFVVDTVDECVAACTQAKLGIDSGVFSYNSTTGKVSVGAVTGELQFKFTNGVCAANSATPQNSQQSQGQ